MKYRHYPVLGSLIALMIYLLCQSAAWAVTDTCPPFYLRTDTGEIINPMTGENADQPFSTRQTCGACHDVDTISKGYHFMMDWDKASDTRYAGTDTPWLVSTGLTGSLLTYGFFQLAKKQNTHPDQIDLSAFDFVARVPESKGGFQKPGCAACHAGGGLLEFDRDGQRYDRRLAENPELADTLDGDYYQSLWDKTGVIEPDCFFCHGSRYHIQKRITQIKHLNFKWAGVAAAGIGQVHGRVSEGEVPKVVYNKRLFNEDGTFYLPDMVFRPEAKNCLICHESIELGKRGNSWADPLNPDVHHLAGLTCIDCHTGDIRHNFAKGNAMDNQVAPELDNSMRSCRDCHTQGYRGATRMRHDTIRKDHLDKLSCEACHIPALHRTAGGAMFLNTGMFGKYGQGDTSRFGTHKTWKPAYIIRAKDRDGIPRITPVNPMLNTLFTNLDEDGIYYPLFLSEVETAYNQSQQQMSDREIPYDFHRKDDIVTMLETLAKTLAGNQRFSSVNPVFHTGGNLYFLKDGPADKTAPESDSTSGSVSDSAPKPQDSRLLIREDTTWVSRLPFYSISHNVAPADQALGSGGCRDCHAKDAHMFSGPVVTDYFGDNGRPVFVSMARFMGLAASVETVNRLFGLFLKTGPWVLGAGVLLILFAGIRLMFFSPSKSLDPAVSGLTSAGIFLFICFILAHGLLMMNTGFLRSVTLTLTGMVPWLGPLSAIIAAAGYFYLVQTRVPHRVVSFGLHVCGAGTVITGILLWIRQPFNSMSLVLISILHGIFAVATAGLLVYFLSIKRRDKGPGHARVHQNHQPNNQRDRHE
jgi:hypothetical protein